MVASSGFGGLERRFVALSGVWWHPSALVAPAVHVAVYVLVRAARMIDCLVVPAGLSMHLPGLLGYIRVSLCFFKVARV